VNLQLNCNHYLVQSDAARAEIRGFPDQAEGSGGDLAPLLDPLAMSLACVGGGPVATAEAVAAPAAATPVSGAFDVVLAAEVLQRVAWGGDRRRGVARLELGGELAGAVVVVRGEGREVTLELTLPAGRSAGELPERLAARLAARGLVVRDLVVR
jgi:hypothetical protein